MSTWYSKHVEENIWRINNIKCITLVFCMINSWCTVRNIKLVGVVLVNGAATVPLCTRYSRKLPIHNNTHVVYRHTRVAVNSVLKNFLKKENWNVPTVVGWTEVRSHQVKQKYIILFLLMYSCWISCLMGRGFWNSSNPVRYNRMWNGRTKGCSVPRVSRLWGAWRSQWLRLSEFL